MRRGRGGWEGKGGGEGRVEGDGRTNPKPAATGLRKATTQQDMDKCAPLNLAFSNEV